MITLEKRPEPSRFWSWATPILAVVLTMIAWASVQDLGTVFGFADLTMALLALTNLLALWALYPVAMSLLKHYETQLETGEAPRFSRDQLSRETLDPESWPHRLGG